MNKYELAVVVSAKLEDEARADVIEKVKALVTRFGGNVTDVDDWGKRRFAYESQKMKAVSYTHLIKGTPQHIPSGMAGFARQGIPIKGTPQRIPSGMAGFTRQGIPLKSIV